MTTNINEKQAPFTYREKGDCCEVVMIVDGEFAQGDSRQYVKCRTEDDAKALANFRLFQHMYEYRHLYSPNELPDSAELDGTIAALEEYRWAHCSGYR